MSKLRQYEDDALLIEKQAKHIKELEAELDEWRHGERRYAPLTQDYKEVAAENWKLKAELAEAQQRIKELEAERNAFQNQCIGLKIKNRELAAQNQALREWVRKVRAGLLYPLSFETSKYGAIAEGFGSATVSLLDAPDIATPIINKEVK